ncbi:MAG: AsmA-like C-terminal region-containing protein [Candidatus Jettenia sp.]|nr:MAG: AsmA-like C-terminal region-containing protein [Candidatus Jettenia sp.]
MQISNEGTLLKWIAISFGIVFCIAFITILTVPLGTSESFVRRKVVQALEDRFESIHEIGPISFHWPNQITISYLIIQKQEIKETSPIRFEEIQGKVKLLSLLTKELVLKKISIQQINYENQFLVEDLVTDEFSFKNDIVFIHAKLRVNDGPTTIKGTIDLHGKEPVFDIFIDAKDVYITQDIQAVRLLPLFTIKEGEIGGILSLSGYLKGKGLDKKVVNEELDADIHIKVRDGYVRGNKLFSSLLGIAGIKDMYSFDFVEASIQIKDGKIYTQKMEMKGPLMSMNASGMAELEGAISYDVAVTFRKEHLGKDIEKIASVVLGQNALPVEIRGTTKDPEVSVKLPKDNLEHLLHDLVNDFLTTSKKKQKKEK